MNYLFMKKFAIRESKSFTMIIRKMMFIIFWCSSRFIATYKAFVSFLQHFPDILENIVTIFQDNRGVILFTYTHHTFFRSVPIFTAGNHTHNFLCRYLERFRPTGALSMFPRSRPIIEATDYLRPKCAMMNRHCKSTIKQHSRYFRIKLDYL